MSRWVTGAELNEKGIRPRYNKAEWFDRKKMRWNVSVEFCEDCLHEAYWDSDYGQIKFKYCPWCGKEKENYEQV